MFFEFGIKDIVDIVLVALMLYYIYRLMKESRSLNVFMGIMVFVVLWLVVSQILEMPGICGSDCTHHPVSGRHTQVPL